MSLRILILILSLTSSDSFAEYFSAPLQKADWKVKKHSSKCQLKHKIPFFGSADFSHQSGELLRFSIRENRFKPEITKASLVVQSSPWIHKAKVMNYHSVHLDKSVDIQNHPRLSVYGETAEYMLDVLAEGMYPTFIYQRASTNSLFAETRVAISAINFSENYHKFINCRKGFLPYGLKQVLEKSIYFKLASKQLNAKTLKQLGDTARYIKEVSGTHVVIVSNTEIAGKKDETWFLKRANAIASKLINLGIPKTKVLVKKGSHPVSDNKMIQLPVFGPDALNAIYYRKGNINLTQLEKRRLDLVVRYFQEFMPEGGLIISSHTDSKGKKRTNLKISKKRGNVIKHYLVSQGLDEKKVKVKAYGESRPVRSNRFPTGRSQNRRAIIKFVS